MKNHSGPAPTASVRNQLVALPIHQQPEDATSPKRPDAFAAITPRKRGLQTLVLTFTVLQQDERTAEPSPAL